MRLVFLRTEPALAEQCIRELVRVGFDAGHAETESPEELSTLLDRTRYDLVLTQYAAPGWSWRAALEALRGRPEGIPLIVLTDGIRPAPAHELRPGGRRGLPAYRRTVPPASLRQTGAGIEVRPARSWSAGRGPGRFAVSPDLRSLSGRHPPGGQPWQDRVVEFPGGRNVRLPVGPTAGQIGGRVRARPYARAPSGAPRPLPGQTHHAAHGFRFGSVGQARRWHRVSGRHHFKPAGYQGRTAGRVCGARHDGSQAHRGGLAPPGAIDRSVARCHHRARVRRKNPAMECGCAGDLRMVRRGSHGPDESYSCFKPCFHVSLEHVETELDRTGQWDGELRHTRRDGVAYHGRNTPHRGRQSRRTVRAPYWKSIATLPSANRRKKPWPS